MTNQSEGEILQPIDVCFYFCFGDANRKVTRSVSLSGSQEVAV